MSDHKFQPGPFGVCLRCGEEKSDHHSMPISRERIDEIAAIPDEAINTSDIPEATEEMMNADKSEPLGIAAYASDYDPEEMRRQTGSSVADIARELSEPISEEITARAVTQAAKVGFNPTGSSPPTPPEVMITCAAIVTFLEFCEAHPGRDPKEWREAVENLRFHIGR